jgi:hypothetical protein
MSGFGRRMVQGARILGRHRQRIHLYRLRYRPSAPVTYDDRLSWRHRRRRFNKVSSRFVLLFMVITVANVASSRKMSPDFEFVAEEGHPIKLSRRGNKITRAITWLVKFTLSAESGASTLSTPRKTRAANSIANRDQEARLVRGGSSLGSREINQVERGEGGDSCLNSVTA